MAPSANLQLPPPKQARVEDVDEVTEASSSAAAAPAPVASRFTSGGLIFPPPDIRAIVDKTATFVARNGTQFEAKIRGDERANTKFAFLNDTDPYNAYYRAKIQLVASGDGPLAVMGHDAEKGMLVRGDASAPVVDEEAEEAARKKREEAGKPEEPAPHEFEATLPSITAVDLDIIKLTALFTARKGRSFASALATKEARSYQFEFLKPSHSLFGFFNKLVEQYRAVLEPAPHLLERLEELAPCAEPPRLGAGRGGGRLLALEEAQKRAKWEKWVRERRKAKETEEESEKGTVELTETDAHIDLPPPMSLREVENMTLAQKRMAAMIMEVEGGTADESQLLGLMDMPGGAGAQAGAAAAVRAPTSSHMNAERAAAAGLPGRPGRADEGDDVEMEVDSEEEEQVVEIKRADGQAPMRVRKNYVPKTLAERQAAAATTTKCPVCSEQIPLADMDEHVRIELLNPKFREQRQALETKQAQHKALTEGADPSRFLKQFAGARTDIFGAQAEEDARRRKADEEARLRKERESKVWDGHANSRTTVRDTFNKAQHVEETMAQIQRQFKVGETDANIGPQLPGMDPAAAAAMAAAQGYAQPPPGMAYPGMMMPPPGVAPPGIHPSRLAGMDASAGLKRPADEAPAGQPAAQRPAFGVPVAPASMGVLAPPPGAPTGPRVAEAAPRPPVQVNSLPKQASGALYTEEQWLRYNPYPITLRVRLPDAPAASPLCDGTEVSFEGLAPTSTIGSVRDRVHAECLKSEVGASKLKLKVGGKAATLKQTLAHWNLLDGDEIVVSLNK